MTRKSAYYYLVASLPHLTVGMPMPIPLADILETCRQNLDPKEMLLLENLSLLSYCSPDLPKTINDYLSWEQCMRNRLVFLRCFKAGVDPDVYVRPDENKVFAGVENYVHEFFNLPTLEEEKKLDEYRWRVLEFVTSADSFNFAVLCAYKLKAEIVRKWVVRKPEVGKLNLEKLVDAVASKVPSLNDFNSHNNPKT